MGREAEQTFFQRKYTNGQQVHEKVLNITYHHGNANPNHNELSTHPVSMTIIKKQKQTNKNKK